MDLTLGWIVFGLFVLSLGLNIWTFLANAGDPTRGKQKLSKATQIITLVTIILFIIWFGTTFMGSKKSTKAEQTSASDFTVSVTSSPKKK